MRLQPSTRDALTVAVLGTGRMAGIHLAALAELRDRGLQVDGRTVRVEPAVYGREPFGELPSVGSSRRDGDVAVRDQCAALNTPRRRLNTPRRRLNTPRRRRHA